jgi:hypothetical protein
VTDFPTEGRRRGALAIVAAVTASMSIGCVPSPIAPARIEKSIAPTFANLVHVQMSGIGLTPVAVRDIRVVANCRKAVPETGPAGAGDWVCVVDWYGPNRKVLRDTYDLAVAAGGCYTATIEGSEAGLGGPTVTTQDGKTVRNLLYAFDGCFDTT